MKKVLFVADLFSEDYIGGAELTTEAIMKCHNQDFVVKKIRCADLKKEHVSEMSDAHWIICNFSQLSLEMKLLICKKLNYSIIEYDYKFCKYRSLQMHLIRENAECNCNSRDENKINLVFYGMAKKVWFMSAKQRDIFLSKVPTIKKENVEVLSSIFSDEDLSFIESLSKNKKNEKFVILSGGSWIKGFEQTVKYATENNIEYEIVQKMGYQDLLTKLSQSRGLLFLPAGEDTCPRLTIEAKLLDCELILNDNVQHKDEEWFSDKQKILNHINNKKKAFWKHYE